VDSAGYWDPKAASNNEGPMKTNKLHIVNDFFLALASMKRVKPDF